MKSKIIILLIIIGVVGLFCLWVHRNTSVEQSIGAETLNTNSDERLIEDNVSNVKKYKERGETLPEIGEYETYGFWGKQDTSYYNGY